MLIEYIDKTFSIGEPIFINEIPYSSKDALRQELKRLTDENKLIRLYNGVYYKPYKTILGTEGKVSINKFINKKFISKNNNVFGFLSGISLYNKYGLTTQIPSTIEVTSNLATTIQRKLSVDKYTIIVYKPLVEINNDNVNELEFLAIMTDIDKYSEINGEELKTKLKQIIKEKNINLKLLKEYLQFYPDKIFKNIYYGGIMNELV